MKLRIEPVRLLFNKLRNSWLLALASLSAVVISCTPFTTTLTATVTSTSNPYDLSYLIDQDPAGVDNSVLPITPLELMHGIGTPPEVNISDYAFTVDGLVDNPLRLSYSDLRSYPPETRVVLLICPLTFADNPSWTGVPFAAILARAGARPEATEIVLKSLDGFEIPLPIDIVPDVLLAYGVDGETLPPVHGYPVRAVITGSIGLYWLRWLEGIEIR